jgi:uncharacterized protein (TIGR02453 family)
MATPKPGKEVTSTKAAPQKAPQKATKTTPAKKTVATPKKAAAPTTATKKTRTASSKKTPSSSSSMTATPTFTPAAQRFLAEMIRRQDREWFKPRKEEFQALLEMPMLALLQAIGPLLLDDFPAVEDATPKVFRIYRDTRFSKDKSPFKNHVGGEFSMGRAGYYVHIAPDELFSAVGVWQMEPETLKHYRQAIVDNDVLGDALLAETQKLETKGYRLMSFGELARAPAGILPTHKRIQLLKHKGWAMTLPMKGISPQSATLPAQLASVVRPLKPALALLERALAAVPPTKGAKR